MSKHVTLLHAHMKMMEMKREADDEKESLSSSSLSSHVLPTTLVDLATPLQQLGEKYFLLHITRQRNALTELLDSLQLGDIEDDAVYAQSVQSVKQTLHSLSSMQKIWFQIFGSGINTGAVLNNNATPQSAVSSSPSSNGWPLTMGMLLEFLSSRLVGMVLEKTDISVESASRMYQLFTIILTQYNDIEVRLNSDTRKGEFSLERESMNGPNMNSNC